MRLLVFGAGVGLVISSMVSLLPAGAQPTTAPTSPPASNQRRWTALSTGTTSDLKAVSFSEPRVGHVVGAGGTILSTADGGETWRRQFACMRTRRCQESSKDRITVDLTGVGFWNPAKGVAVGAGGTIISTADGGKTWTSRAACEATDPCEAGSSDRIGPDLTAVSVVAPSHAYAVGKAGTMVTTGDHGRTWRRLVTCDVDLPADATCEDSPANQRADLTGVAAASPFVAHAVGPGGALFGVNEGGNNVRPIRICVDGCAAPLSPRTGSGVASARGDDADTFVVPRITTDLAGVAHPRSGRGGTGRIYAVGAAGTIVANDGGIRWTDLFACANAEPCAESSPDRVRTDLRAVAFSLDLVGYAVGAGGTIVSLELPSPRSDPLPKLSDLPADSPQWRPEDSGTTKDLEAVSFPSPDAGYAVGDDGTVVKRSAPAPAVRVERVEPARGLNIGRTQVSITGRGFTGATDVYFGLTRAFGVTVVSDTTITATTPPGPAGTVPVTVGTPGGLSPAAPSGRFSYVAPAGGTWERASTCPSGCFGSAVALPEGKVVAVGVVTGSDARATPGPTEVYSATSRKWTASAPLAQPRAQESVTALSDGRVLVAGGTAVLPAAEAYQNSLTGNVEYRPRAEVFDPVAGEWSPAGDMVQPRIQHTATLLSDGRVLVSGGVAPGRAGIVPTAEIWDPRSRTWSPTGSMNEQRTRHTATRLADGTVLVVGGAQGEAPSSSAELYDPARGTWRTTATPKTVHAFGHTVTVMRTGEALVVGGTAESQNTVPFAERYDPKADTWTPLAPLRVARADHTATLLADGRLLVAGGTSDDPAQDTDGAAGTASVEIYDAATGRWTLVADMPAPGVRQTALLLRTGCGRDCGKVLVSGTDQFLYQPPPRAATASSKDDEPGAGKALTVGGGLVAVLAALLLARKVARR